MTNKLEKGSVTVSLDIRVPMTLKKKIRDGAKVDGVSLSEWMRDAAQEKLRNSA